MNNRNYEPWELSTLDRWQRNSGLHMDTFNRPRTWHIVGVIVAAIALALLIACAAL